MHLFRQLPQLRPVFRVALTIEVLLVPLLLGGVHRTTILSATLFNSLLIGALCWCYWAQRDRSRKTITATERAHHVGLVAPIYGLVLGVLAAYTAAQLIPLSPALLQHIAPETFGVLQVSLGRPLVSWQPISLDPSATLFELLKLFSYAFVFIVAYDLFRRSARQKRVLGVFALFGALVALLGVASAFLTPGSILFFYRPERPPSGAIATTFVNPNHSAAFLMMSASVALGLALDATTWRIRSMMIGAAVVSGAGLALTKSPGGMVALIASLATLMILVFLQRVSASRSPKLPRNGGVSAGFVAVFVSFCVAVVLGVLLSGGSVNDDFLRLTTTSGIAQTKLSLWPAGWDLVQRNPWVGIGRGAFLTVFPRYLRAGIPPELTYSHLENDYLHLPAEWGIAPGGGAILLTLILGALAVYRIRAIPYLVGVAAALVGLAVQSIVDFHLSLVGIALPATVLFALLMAQADEQRNVQRKLRRCCGGVRVGSYQLGALLLLAVAVFGLSIYAAIAAPPSAEEDGRRIYEMMERFQHASAEQKKRSKNAALHAAVAASRRHPADYLPHLLASELAPVGSRQALRELNRALYLYPRSVAAHQAAARLLDRMGRRPQALMESRLALIYGASLNPALLWALPRCEHLEDVLRLLPRDKRTYRAAVRILRYAIRKKIAAGVLARASQVWPNECDFPIDEAALLSELRDDDAARRAASGLSVRCGLKGYLAEIDSLMPERSKEALALLRAGIKAYPDAIELRARQVEAYLARNDLVHALAAAEAALPVVSGVDELARVRRLLAKVYRARGNSNRARYEENAATTAP